MASKNKKTSSQRKSKTSRPSNEVRVAIIHDYLREYGGAERVLEALHELFPDAPVYTAFVDKEAMGLHWAKFADWQIKETWLAKIPFIKQIFSPLRFLAAPAFQSLDLSAFDVVIASSNAYQAKAVQVPNGTLICYCHTPPRSLYGYTTRSDWKSHFITRLGGNLINHYMRMVDFEVAQKVDVFIANSVETQRRITKFYRRDSQVIFPPVDIPEHAPKKRDGKYFLYVNRLALSKHPEMAVEVCTALNLPLKVVGKGPMLPILKDLAGPTVEFTGSITDQELHRLYDEARALIYPVEDEDFGIVPVEAMGHGLPVIAHRSGGPRETVIENKTGVFFDELTVKGLAAAVNEFEEKLQKSGFDRQKIYKHSQEFTKEEFGKKILKLVGGVKV